MFGIISGIASAVCDLCSGIGSAVMGGVSSFAIGFTSLFPEIAIIEMVIRIIEKVAELIIGKPEEEKPEELGMKAEEADLKPEDFDSIEAYIEYLRTEIKVDQEKMNSLSDEERRQYAMVGVGLYVKQAEEKYDMKMEPRFWDGVAGTKLTPDQTKTLITEMKNNDIKDASQYTDFLGNRLQPGIQNLKVYQSVKSMLNPDETRSFEQVEADIAQMKERFANRKE